MCFLCVFMCKNVLGREEKSAENIQIERKTQKSPFFGLEVIGAFYNLSTLYEVTTFQGSPPSNDLRSG